MFIRADISALPATKFQYTFYGNIANFPASFLTKIVFVSECSRRTKIDA